MLSSILICGNDPTLLLTRKLVLEHAGFRVDAVLGLSRLVAKAGEAVLLCSSLSESEQLEAIRSTQANRPDAKLLVVGGEERGSSAMAVMNMSSLASAETLIENAKRLLQ